MTDLEKLLADVTPGEWRVEDRTTLVWGDCNQNDTSTYGMGYPIAEARRTPSASWAKGPKDYEEAEANAQLIAMAPDLARKVIAAEKLAKAVRDVVTAYAEPDQLICCNGYMCGCRGSSVRDMADHYVREALAAWEAAQAKEWQ